MEHGRGRDVRRPRTCNRSDNQNTKVLLNLGVGRVQDWEARGKLIRVGGGERWEERRREEGGEQEGGRLQV